MGRPGAPWAGDACSLVDAFRRGERSPSEELEAVLDAIGRSSLNAFSFLDADGARERAARADTSQPFGGVPIGVKELDAVAGWPDTEACTVFASRRAAHTSVMVDRAIRRGGANPVGLCTASEFGGVNVTRTVLNGATHNPWRHGTTPGGSSGGSAAAVAGGIVTLATGGDGGGSIRIPAGFTGLVGLKATFGRIPRAPKVQLGNLTVATGVMARSVRDVARWFDTCNGRDDRDPFSLPRAEGWERGLGTLGDALRGRRIALAPDWGGAVVAPRMWGALEEAASGLARATGMSIATVDTSLPRMGAAWSVSGMLEIRAQLGEAWPACAGDLTPEIRFGLEATEGAYGPEARARIEARRMELNERMAAIFSEVDFVVAASNPDVAFPAEGPLPSTFGGIEAGAGNNGRLTFPANLHGNPAISLPAGLLDGLPIGLQINARHHHEPLLLELGVAMSRLMPWPLVAPGSPR
ncbi:MAG: amidase [Acidobacteria bacterium]|nr:amidase [Acidobacteriota bacterium]